MGCCAEWLSLSIEINCQTYNHEKIYDSCHSYSYGVQWHVCFG